MLFRYQGLDATGHKVRSKIEAGSLEEAKQKLKNKKVIYTKIQEERSFQSFSLGKKKLDNLNLSYMSRDLSIYLQSGISLVQAVKLLKQRYENEKKFFSFFESIEIFLDEGKNFYTALEQQKVFALPEFYKQSIKVSENGGLLASVLLQLSVFLKEQDRIRKQVSTAFAYPLFILTVSVFMVGFMLSYVVPKITEIFTQFDKELPGITSFVIGLGDFFSLYALHMLVAFVVFIVVFSFMLKKSKKFKYAVDTFLLKVPFFSTLLEFNELSRFAYMNSILVSSGVPFVQAVKLSADIAKNSVIKTLFVNASSKVVEGEKLSVILNKSKVYKIDTSFIHAIAIGEETSQLSSMLENLAKLYNESNKDKIAILLALLEPLLMLIVGGIIGFIVLAMLLPIFTMNLG
jgi:general secretion pathway protein F/type IV pilus assembly protein PilC